MTHSELTKSAYAWLLKIGCSFALRELVTAADEQPDAIGWKNNYSILVECKTSRADFLSDKKKFFRRYPNMGVGTYRFYLCPENLIQLADLPPKWGLLWAMSDGKVKRVHAPKGNIWRYWPRFKVGKQAEITMLCSALRRVHKNGDLEKIL